MRKFEREFAGRRLIVEVGQLAQFANGSCVVRYGDTVVLSTATASKKARPDIDFFPLSVEYEEKMYSVGKFPGGFIKREGRPSEKAILASRAIDRPMRPLFPKDLRNDVVINNLVLSVEQDCSPEFAAMFGSSLAVAISDIPFNGPVATVQLGLKNGKTLINPTEAQKESSEMFVTLAGTLDKICMIEAAANEVPDEQMLASIMEGHQEIQKLCAFILEIQKEVGKEKFAYESSFLPEEFFAEVKELGFEKMAEAVLSDDKDVRDVQVRALQDELTQVFEEKYTGTEAEAWLKLLPEAFYQLQKKVVRHYLFAEHKRVDGRSMDEIRPLSCDVGLLPRVHGSGLFQRGQTQVLTTCTLGPLSAAQSLDGLDNEQAKRYMHHYNMPGYSVGEAKAPRSPGRREIGHGALAEKSLIPVLPSEEEFPYAIRTVSEILMSNGSTSQGSVCASTLALMDAGVPIKRPVAGISCGLILNEENEKDYTVFMDIQGIEDFFGDMDFKVAGTTEGITSIQVDIKVDGLSYDIIRDAFAMTKKGRLHIIEDIILKRMPTHREELSVYAPKIISMSIPVDKIREVIGTGGKIINRIIAETGVALDIQDDGQVYISYVAPEAGEKAKNIIEAIVRDPIPGQVFDGKVTRIMDFGAFVEFAPGKEGMVHASKIAWHRVEDVRSVLKEGDSVKVKVLEIDQQGRINLSMREFTEQPEGYVEKEERPRFKSERPSFDKNFKKEKRDHSSKENFKSLGRFRD